MYPFHLAFAVTDLEATRRFYADTLGCESGRESADRWLDFNLFGHQLTAHVRASDEVQNVSMGAVDGDMVPIPHFGVILDPAAFEGLAQRLEADQYTDWIMKPKRRMVGQPGEQATMFVRDPSGNGIEFKAFADQSAIFAG